MVQFLFPGNYPITNANEKITDIIERAGGLTDDAFPFGSEFIRGEKKINISFRSILKNPRSRNNFVVLEGDAIKIAKKPDMIEITGNINSPGFYKFSKNKDLNITLTMLAVLLKMHHEQHLMLFMQMENQYQ